MAVDTPKALWLSSEVFSGEWGQSRDLNFGWQWGQKGMEMDWNCGEQCGQKGLEMWRVVGPEQGIELWRVLGPKWGLELCRVVGPEQGLEVGSGTVDPVMNHIGATENWRW